MQFVFTAYTKKRERITHMFYVDGINKFIFLYVICLHNIYMLNILYVYKFKAIKIVSMLLAWNMNNRKGTKIRKKAWMDRIDEMHRFKQIYKVINDMNNCEYSTTKRAKKSMFMLHTTKLKEPLLNSIRWFYIYISYIYINRQGRFAPFGLSHYFSLSLDQ